MDHSSRAPKSWNRGVARAGAVLAFGSALVWAPNVHADPLVIKVRGTGRIEARASRIEGETVLSGSLVDDAGQPLVGQTLTVLVTRDSDPRDPSTANGVRGARGCERSADRGGRGPTAYGVRVAGPADAPEVLVVTDEDGRFCLRAALEPDRYSAHVSWRGTPLVDRADVRLPFDGSRRPLVLRFDPTPRVVSLDTPRHTFEAVAIVEDNGAPGVAPGLPLTLSDDRGEALGAVTTDGSGRGRFVLDAPRLGPPGRGELRLASTGSADVAFASAVTEIERRAKVVLRVPAAERGELRPENPEDGIPLVVEVGCAAGAVSEGGVEARVGDVIVGAAPVERGIARLTLTFAARGTEALVHLRYVPVAPWYEPLGEPTVTVPIRGPGLAAKAPILVAGAAVLAFFLLGRVTSSRRARAETKPEQPASDAQRGEPRVALVRPANPGERGWRGRVVDAHEGTPVTSARVWIERGTFEGRTVLASVACEADGTFELPPMTGLVGDEQLGAEAPLHGRLVQPLPPDGELSVALVLRRRALLARLVSWARRRGGPFDARPEPTPGHVKRAAGEEFPVARWADAIERAVFGGGEVDARAEREIEQLAPDASARDAPDEGRR